MGDFFCLLNHHHHHQIDFVEESPSPIATFSSSNSVAATLNHHHHHRRCCQRDAAISATSCITTTTTTTMVNGSRVNGALPSSTWRRTAAAAMISTADSLEAEEKGEEKKDDADPMRMMISRGRKDNKSTLAEGEKEIKEQGWALQPPAEAIGASSIIGIIENAILAADANQQQLPCSPSWPILRITKPANNDDEVSGKLLLREKISNDDDEVMNLLRPRSHRASHMPHLILACVLAAVMSCSTNLAVATAQHSAARDAAAMPTTPRRTVPDSEDDLYILLDEISVFSCRGIKNEIRLSEDDVEIVNDKGNKVYFIKAPGNYSLHFKNINVLHTFGYLTGEIGVTLQVPLLEGPAGIRFDVPYTMIPETGLLHQQCDENSGIVERDKRQYCRYCELCGLSERVEAGLNQGEHQFLPQVARGEEPAFSPKCGRIEAKQYSLKRTINLPGRKALEEKVKQKISGVDEEIRKRLNKGRGRFQVFLNLISAEQPPITQKAWFDGSDQCRCCNLARGGKDVDPALAQQCRNVLSFLYCNAEDCKSAWAQQCLHNSARIVACYTVEFNYHMTTRWDEVQRFLAENNYPNQETATRPSPPPLPSPSSSKREKSSASAKTAIEDGAGSGANSAAGGGSESMASKCVAQMPVRLTHLRRYCTIFWNEKLCCAHCEGVC